MSNTIVRRQSCKFACERFA